MVGLDFGGYSSEDLSFAGEAAEGARMEDARRVSRERSAIGVWGLGMGAPGEEADIAAGNGDSGR